MDYSEFLQAKHISTRKSGIPTDDLTISPKLFPFQRDIVLWALQLGRAAIFAECGLGKTAMQLEWAKHIVNHTGGRVLILAPLAVAHQTVSEGHKFDVTVAHCKSQFEVGDDRIIIANYERLHLFDPAEFVGVVLDESSILKSFTGSTKRHLIEAFRKVSYKLACTATPAPNDHLELGNHADFLDVMASNEMISRWFINDTMEAGNYRLKKHGERDFWRWLTSWAVCISHPCDLGSAYDMPDFNLPELRIEEHIVDIPEETYQRALSEGRLIPDTSPSSTMLAKVKRESLSNRVEKAKEIVASIPDDEPIIFWCDLNDEADALQVAFPEAIEVRGSYPPDQKSRLLTQFSNREARIIITKPDIAGFGLNWQHCSHMIFIGVSYSFEKTYQALRRSWRFGQRKPVHAHMIYALSEGNVLATLHTKQEMFKAMQDNMNEAMREHGLFRPDSHKELTTPVQDRADGQNWTLYLGDCVEVVKQLPDNSVDFSVYSPPFTNLYIYSDSIADMGNAKDDDEFFDHYEYLIKELYRITLPGRLSAVHCKDLPLYMNRDGAAGLRDFPGEIIRRHEKHGWVFHSRVTIWKDPVIEMQRTKNHGLLHKNFTERSEACRQGMADYLIVFRKWDIEGGRSIQQHRVIGDYIGTNPPEPYEFRAGKRSEEDNYSIAVWQRYASPVWFDIDQTNVLNYQLARSDKDEKHIAPLQLDVIARAIDIWSAPGETILTPFAGIGSEVYQAVKQRRKGIGIELKPEYFQVAIQNCTQAEFDLQQPNFLDLLDG